jgi:hypothetical protein
MKTQTRQQHAVLGHSGGRCGNQQASTKRFCSLMHALHGIKHSAFLYLSKQNLRLAAD